MSEARELGLPDLQMEEIGMRVRVTVGLAEQIDAQSPPIEVKDQVGTKPGPSRDQVKILRNCLEEKPIVDLMALWGRTNRTKFRNQVLQPLIDNGLIEMTIPDKPRSSNQRYRITVLGKEVLRKAGKNKENR